MSGQNLFKVQDINAIIKVFAFSIQDRFEQIDGGSRATQQAHSTYNQQSIESVEHLIRKYRGYFTHDEKQVKYLERLVVRILQILDFFKDRSKNLQVLAVVIKKIAERLNKIIKIMPVDVQSLYSYIIELARSGFTVKKICFKDRKFSLKKMQPPLRKPAEKPQPEATNEPKNQADSGELKDIVEVPATSNKKKRPLSLYARKSIKIPSTKQNIQTEIAKLYSILDVDLNYFGKSVMQAKDKARLEKQALRQNGHILEAILEYDKAYSAHAKKRCHNQSVLREVNNRSVSKPMTNNWVSRKKKNTVSRKKCYDTENLTFV